MPALKEFANFVTLNTANLAETYAQLLAENGSGYEIFPVDRRMASARRLLKAVIESFETESSAPLTRIFDDSLDEDPRRWPKDINPPQPLQEVECLGHTLAPVVTNLESSKFLWQILSEVRVAVFQFMEKEPSHVPAFPKEGLQKEMPPLETVERGQVEEALEKEGISETKIHSLLIATDEAVMLLDEKGFIDCNEATLRIFGYNSRERLINTHPSEQSPPQQPDGQDSWTAANERIATAYKEGSHRFEWVHCRADGTLFPAEVSLTVMELEGKQILQAIVRDISEYKQAQEDLVRERTLLRTLIDSLPDLIYVKDTESRFLVSNIANARMLKRTTPDEVIGKTDWDFYPEEMAAQFYAEEQAIIQSGQPAIGREGFDRDLDGNPVWTSITKVPLRDSRGEIIGLVGMGRDITQRKQTEDELKRSRDFLDNILNAIDDPVFVKDEEHRRVILNDAACRMIGYSKEELIGKSDYDLYSQEHADMFWEHDERVLKTGKTDVNEEEISWQDELHTISTKKSIYQDPVTKKKFIVGVIRDITEIKRAQAALAEERNLLRALIDNVPDRIYAKDTQGRFIICNVATVRRMGKTSPDEIVGKSDFDFVPSELAERFYADEQAIIQSGQSVINREEPLEIGEDGQVTRWNLATKVPLQDNQGNIMGIVGLGREITELKRTEEALQENEHRLKTIMASVQAGIVIIDAETRQIVETNPAALQMIGAAEDEVIGSLCHQFICPAEQGRCPVCDLGQTVDHSERVLLTVQGEAIPIIKNVVVVTLGGHKCLVESFVNITQQKQAEEILAKRITELETVAEVSTAVSTILDPRKLLQTVVDLTKERFNLYHAHVYLLSKTGDTLELFTGAGEIGRQMVAEGWHIPLEREQSLVARTARTRRGIIVNDVRAESGWLPNALLPDTRSELAVPLIVGDRLLGVLDVQADEVGHFQDEDLHIQNTLAAQVSVALQNAEQHEQTHIALTDAEILAREQTVLNELGQMLTARLSVEQVLEEVYRQASRLIDTTNFCIGLYDSEKDEITFPFMVTDAEIKREVKAISADEELAGYIVRLKTSLLLEDNIKARQEALGIKVVGQEALSWLGVPLMIGDRVLGVMTVQSFTTPNLYDGHSRELLTAIGSQVAIALQNAMLFENIIQAQKEAESRLRETQIFQQLTQTLAGTLAVNEAIEAFFQAGIQLLNADYAIFSLVDKAQQRVKAVSGFNVSDDHIQRANHPLDSDDIMADIIRKGETELITGWDPRFDPGNFMAEGMDEWGLRIFTPITVRQENIGLVEVGFKEKVDVDVQDTQVKLLRTLVDQTAVALEGAQRYEISQRAAYREQTIRQITEKIRTADSVGELVETAARELGKQLSAGHVVVELGIEE